MSHLGQLGEPFRCLGLVTESVTVAGFGALAASADDTVHAPDKCAAADSGAQRVGLHPCCLNRTDMSAVEQLSLHALSSADI